MPTLRDIQLARFDLIDGGIAMARRHIEETKVHLAKAEAFGWQRGAARAGELIALSEQRLARLEEERDELLARLNLRSSQQIWDEAKR